MGRGGRGCSRDSTGRRWRTRRSLDAGLVRPGSVYGLPRRRVRHNTARAHCHSGAVSGSEPLESARIQVNQVKTQVWNKWGRAPHIATTCSPEPTAHPMTCGVVTQHCGCTDFVEAQLAEKTEEHGILLERIQSCPISSVRGCCGCSVQHQEPVAFFELSIPNTVSSSPSATMQGSSSALKIWCTPRSHSQWEMASAPLLVGRAGRTHSQ